ncbi:MAG: 4'-phosphopantetheinyl transferase superfamily protein [Dehalococcoidia bacterium]|nr:4'-phosphopantetheinyl transferase superfamily protein [Dehalococcoidia bacterium]
MTFCTWDPRTVNVWLMELSSGGAAIDLDGDALLDHWENERLTSLQRRDDKLRFLISHRLARILIAEHCSIDPADIHFGLRSGGKPFVRAPRPARAVEFSLSHTNGLVGCAATFGCSVGLDVEAIDEQRDLSSLLRHALTPDELNRWTSATPEEETRTFLQLWTLKEALAKGLGRGLAIPPTSLGFRLAGRLFAQIHELPAELGHTASWEVFSTTVRGSHAVGLAANIDDCRPIQVHWRMVPPHLAISTFDGSRSLQDAVG